MAHEVLESMSHDDSIHTALEMPDERFNGQLNNDISAKTNDSGVQTGIQIHKLTKVRSTIWQVDGIMHGWVYFRVNVIRL